MDMSMEELDRLKNMNLERIKNIEERYLMKKNELKDVKQIFREKTDQREVK